MIGVSFSICCLIFLIILLWSYFSKQRLHNLNNKLFTNLLIINIIGVFIDVGGFISFKHFGVENTLNILISKIYLIYYLTYIFCFALYIYNISTKNLNKILKKTIIVFIAVALIVFLLPINLYFENNIGYSYGISVNVAYIIGSILIAAMLYYLIRYIKNIGIREYIPLFAFVLLTVVTLIIQKINPEITMLLLSNTIVTYLMYFTIENPDLKMVNELKRNKMILEKTNEGNSNFLFKITTDARKYLENVTNICNNMLNENNKDIYKQGTKNIKNQTKDILMKINNIIDVTAIDIKNIKITNQTYNTKQLFEEIKRTIQNKINKNINFITKISTNIPPELNGDNIRLKQIIISVLENSIQNTLNGFISLEVNTIVKYDTCRLIISIEDSGKGLNLEKVNNILSSTEEITEKDLNQIDTLNMDLKMVKKVINLLGGSFILNSEKNKGTKVTITLDQKIAENISTNFETKLSEYDKILGIKKVLIVDDNIKELEDIKKQCNELNVEAIGTMYGKDCLDKIRIGQQYDLIILDDSTNTINAISLLKELKTNKNFNSPVVVLLNEKKVSLHKHYLKDGFADYIDKSKLNTGIKKVINTYCQK